MSEKQNKNNSLSRRKFIKLGGLALGTMGTGLLVGCDDGTNITVVPPTQTGAPSTLPTSWDDEADFVHMGFGGASAMAAIHTTKSVSGSTTLILEQHTAGGGSTKICGAGTYMGASTATQVADGYTETADEFYKNVLTTVGAGGDADIIRTYADNIKATYDALVEAGVQYGGYQAGYMASPTDATKSLIYDNEKRPEIIAATGTTSPVPHAHFALADTTAGLTRAATMWRALENTVLALSNVKISYGTEVKSLIVNDDGRVVGVSATKDGATKYYKAKKAVLICCGGFINNDEMVKQFIPHAMDCTRGGNGRDKGTGIKIAQAIGADVKLMDSAEDYCPTFLETSAFVKAIAVNPYGDRFAPEDLGGTEMGKIIARQLPESYLIFDKQTYDEIPEPLRSALPFDSANTVEALAALIDIVPQYLADTVARYNASANGGFDQQYQKDPSVLRALTTAPFYAYKRVRARVFTLSCGGLRINTKTQVLKSDGTAIEGLYAAGATTAHVNAQYYVAGGGTSGAFTFGRIAGLEMAKETSWV